MTCRNLMTIPGIGAITSVAFTAAVDDSKRFGKSRSIGAYFGLTNRRDQSGEHDIAGRISKRGDNLVRGYLYEAATVLLTRTKSWSALKSWGLRIAKRSCMNKAKIAVSRSTGCNLNLRDCVPHMGHRSISRKNEASTPRLR
jgi:transposase